MWLLRPGGEATAAAVLPLPKWQSKPAFRGCGPTCGRIGSEGGPVDDERPPETLTERDREILAFEREWWVHSGGKERLVRERFGVSATRYYQILNTLVASPAALAEDPMLVKRLQRLRDARRRQRAARRLGVRE